MLKKKLLCFLLFWNGFTHAQTQDTILKKTTYDEQWNKCSHLSLNNNGDTISSAFCAKYLSKDYSFQTIYIDKQPYSLMIYRKDPDEDKLVAEFWYIKRTWQRVDFHCKSVSFRNRLLKIYLKQKKYVQYEQIWYE